MTEQFINQLTTQLQKELQGGIKFGAIELCITIHDSKPVKFELNMGKKFNLTASKKSCEQGGVTS